MAGNSGDVIAVEGSARHPANLGRLCVKGASLHETLDLGDRLLHPMVDGQQVSWNQALDRVADGFKQTIEKHGPDSVAFYLSGQLLTEDYYVANKLMKGFIGSANVDTNSRLCMASAVAGYKRAFGSDTVPCNYEDLERCDLLVMVGSNAAWTHPVLYQRIVAAKAERPQMRVVVIDPRRTNTCDIADLHLPIKPGTDAHLFSGLLRFLESRQCLDREYIDRYTEGFDQARAAAEHWTLSKTAGACDLDSELLEQFFDWYSETRKTVSFYSQGINQSSSGTDKCNAIINCHLATGRIGEEGMGPFSITGQPNAMGGREVGGLANQLAAHMGFTPAEVDRVGRFWGTDKVATAPGLLAVDLFDAIDEGKVKAVWIMATNPVVSLPDADKVKRALGKCDLVVVSDCVAGTDTGQLADVLLPALGWSEKQGTVTNSERRISLQPALKEAAGEARDDWWAMAEVAKRMGWQEAFDYASAYEVFIEHARLSGFENGSQKGAESASSRAFDISALANLTEEQYLTLEPVQWPIREKPTRGAAPFIGTPRMFTDGRFYTPSGKAQFIAIEPRGPVAGNSGQWPYTLNTGRIRDQWHTMTRTGKAERLGNHIASPFVSINPTDAQELAITEDQLVEISNQYGRFQGRAQIDGGIRPGELFVPIHWTGQNSSMGRTGAVVNPHRDPLSGQPEFKQTPVTIQPLAPRLWGTLVITETVTPEALPLDFWVSSRVDDRKQARGYRYQFADDEGCDWSSWFIELFGPDIQLASYLDRQNDDLRMAVTRNHVIEAVVFQSPTSEGLPDAAWATQLLGKATSQLNDLLAGRPPAGFENGKLVCTCFQVGEKQIQRAWSEGCRTVEALGEALHCGTNCGSCVPELKQLLVGFA